MTFVHWRRFHFFTELRLKEPAQDSSPEPTAAGATVVGSVGLNDLSRLQQLDEDHLAHSELQNENVTEQLNKIAITSSASGRGSLVLGDESGFIHTIDRQLKVQSFQAFSGKVAALQLLHKDPYLVAAGQNGSSQYQIKIWNIERFDANKLSPHCLRTIRSPNEKSAICSLTVNEHLSLLLVGFRDGQVAIVRGDLTRERSTRTKLIKLLDDNSPVNGIFMKQVADMSTNMSSWQIGNRLRGLTRQPNANQSAIVFLITDRNIFCLQLKTGTETVTLLENQFGCQTVHQCALVGEGLGVENSLFIVGRPNAVYFYHLDGQGPCLAFESEKHLLHWHKGYLIIITNEPLANAGVSSSGGRRVSTDGGEIGGRCQCTVYDIQNKFIAYSSSFARVRRIFSEWGSIVLLTERGELIELQEKDMSSKLELLFKKQQYSLAIELAKAQQYSQDSLMDIFKQYADHLYRCGDHEGAIAQYVRTIGKLEPSYVIRKYLNGQKIRALTVYLEEIHRRQVATQEHTTLLINNYAKLKDLDKLNEFLRDNYADDGETTTTTTTMTTITANSKDIKSGDLLLEPSEETSTKKRFFFDVPTAIHVLRQSKFFQEALFLAEKHFCYNLYFCIQMEDLQDFDGTLQFVRRNFTKQIVPCPQTSELIRLLKRYGRTLLSHEPDATFELVKTICDHMERISKPKVDEKKETTPITTTSTAVSELDDLISALDSGIKEVEKGGQDDLSHRQDSTTPNNDSSSAQHSTDSFNPADFIEMFVQNPTKKREFLQYIIEKKPSFANSAIYTAFLDLNLQAYRKEPVDSTMRLELRNKILDLLNGSSNYDLEQAVALCQIAAFREGVLCLYEQMQLYELLLLEHMQATDPPEHGQVIEVCRRFGEQQPSLWLKAFWHFVKLKFEQDQFNDLPKLTSVDEDTSGVADSNADNDSNQLKPSSDDTSNPAYQLCLVLEEVLSQKLISMNALIRALAENGHIPLSVVSQHLTSFLTSESECLHENQALISDYQAETEKIKSLLETIECQPRVFQSSKCSICNNPLDLPAVHFLCLHAFHRDCFESHSGEHDSVCPLCLPEQRKVLRLYEASLRQSDAQMHSQFVQQVNTSDPMSVVARYFSKNIFR